MELDGKIIGIISNDYIEEDYSGKKVEEIITYKISDALKMVKLDEAIKSVLFDDLSSRDKNKVILASHLHDKEIRLVNFSKGMIKKDLEYFSTLFKRIANYGRKIILVDKNLEMFLNCIDHIYIIEDEKIVYETKNIFDNILTKCQASGNYNSNALETAARKTKELYSTMLDTLFNVSIRGGKKSESTQTVTYGGESYSAFTKTQHYQSTAEDYDSIIRTSSAEYNQLGLVVSVSTSDEDTYICQVNMTCVLAIFEKFYKQALG